MNEDFSVKDILIAAGVLTTLTAGIMYVEHLSYKYQDKKRAAKMIAKAHEAAKEITEGSRSNEGRIKTQMYVAGVMLGISLAFITEFRDQDLRKATVEEARVILDAAIAQRFPN